MWRRESLTNRIWVLLNWEKRKKKHIGDKNDRIARLRMNQSVGGVHVETKNVKEKKQQTSREESLRRSNRSADWFRVSVFRNSNRRKSFSNGFFSYRKVTQKFLTSVFFSRSVWLKTIRLPAARAGGFFSPCWSSSSFLFVWSFIKQSTETIRISSIVRLRFVEFLEETQIIVNNRRQTTCSLCFVVFGITKTLIIIEIIKEYWRKKESQ